ncbi:hypothetical protein [Streptomyces sp. NPDC059071]|uniref:hypothetical protein n=1 Tax=unclassified Streptomyces TaxID=2593676 RepID=UPI00364B1026
MTIDGEGYGVQPASLDRSSHLLFEIAVLLHEGRPDGELSVLARKPRAHYEVGHAVEFFARDSRDQFLRAISLIAALSTKLRVAKGAYVEVDLQTRAALDALLDFGTYVPAPDRWRPTP